MHKTKPAILLAILAAALYAVNVPASKLLLKWVAPTVLAGLLYLGAGVGFSFLLLAEKTGPQFWPALGIMLWATVLLIKDTLRQA